MDAVHRVLYSAQNGSDLVLAYDLAGRGHAR